jgi:hypothetical protein
MIPSYILMNISSDTIESSLEVTEPTNIVAYKQYISIDNWEKL